MDKFKERILTLEKKVDVLDTKVGSIQGTTISVHPSHYSVYDKEQGETPLDEFDTFRFMRCGDTMNIYNAQGQQYQIKQPMYKLINPPKELRSYIKSNAISSIPSWSQNPQHYIQHLNTEMENRSDILLSFSTNNENEIEHSDFEIYIFPNKNGPTRSLPDCGYNIRNSSDVKKMLSSKVWEITDNISRYSWQPFIQDITVDFKNTYKLLPHVSCYVTPFQGANISVKIKELTKKKVVFTMSYGEYDDINVSPSACLHWLVNGMVE